jgi:hemerythrin
MSKQTAVEWFYDKIKSHFEHDGDLLETLTFTMAIAKKMEREQIIESFMEGTKMHNINDELSARFNGCIYYGENFGGKDE